GSAGKSQPSADVFVSGELWKSASLGRCIPLQHRLRLQQAVTHGARVPVLKLLQETTVVFDDINGVVPLGRPISIDVTFENRLGVENTELLSQYATCPLCVELVQRVKKWVKENGFLRNATNGMHSSYTYTLMVIAFLQQLQVLPCLQTGPGAIAWDWEYAHKWRSSAIIRLSKIWRSRAGQSKLFEAGSRCESGGQTNCDEQRRGKIFYDWLETEFFQYLHERISSWLSVLP
ncbi:unnamed protein product, partial [Amoebophrya sp. A25]